MEYLLYPVRVLAISPGYDPPHNKTSPRMARLCQQSVRSSDTSILLHVVLCMWQIEFEFTFACMFGLRQLNEFVGKNEKWISVNMLYFLRFCGTDMSFHFQNKIKIFSNKYKYISMFFLTTYSISHWTCLKLNFISIDVRNLLCLWFVSPQYWWGQCPVCYRFNLCL